MKIELDDRQFSTVIAALRYYQYNMQPSPEPVDDWVWEIASDCGKLTPLGSGEIDNLCEAINTQAED